MINLLKAEQTFEVVAAREALKEGCKLAQRFQCDHFDHFDGFDLEGYLEAVEGLAGHISHAAAMAAWLSNGRSADSFNACYQGEWVSARVFTEDLVDDCGLLDDVTESLVRYYFDYDAYSRDIFIDDYTFLDGGGTGYGYVFINR